MFKETERFRRCVLSCLSKAEVSGVKALNKTSSTPCGEALPAGPFCDTLIRRQWPLFCTGSADFKYVTFVVSWAAVPTRPVFVYSLRSGLSIGTHALACRPPQHVVLLRRSRRVCVVAGERTGCVFLASENLETGGSHIHASPGQSSTQQPQQ